MAKWTEKYRPKRLDDIIGNKQAKDELLRWANSWESGPPKKRAVVLMGDPGIGKTTASLALANDLGWQVIEMNASDSRNAEAVKNVAMLGAMGETFTDTGEFVSRLNPVNRNRDFRRNSNGSQMIFCQMRFVCGNDADRLPLL